MSSAACACWIAAGFGPGVGPFRCVTTSPNVPPCLVTSTQPQPRLPITDKPGDRGGRNLIDQELLHLDVRQLHLVRIAIPPRDDRVAVGEAAVEAEQSRRLHIEVRDDQTVS